MTRRAWSPREVADQLAIPYETVLGLIHAGHLRAVKAGRYYLIPAEALDDYLGGSAKSA